MYKVVVILICLLLIGGLAVYMFNPFAKKFKNISEYPDAWSVAQGVIDGKPIFTRYRSGINEAIGHPNYPFQIGIAIPLNSPTEDGLPANEEGNRLGQIEDAISAVLQLHDETVFVLSITTGGMREFVFYASEWKPEYYEAKVKEAGKSFAEHDLQFMMQPDKNWDTFRQFTK